MVRLDISYKITQLRLKENLSLFFLPALSPINTGQQKMDEYSFIDYLFITLFFEWITPRHKLPNNLE